MEQTRQPAKDKDPLELYPQGRLLQVSAILRIFLTVIDPFKQDGSVTEVRRTNIRPVERVTRQTRVASLTDVQIQ